MNKNTRILIAGIGGVGGYYGGLLAKHYHNSDVEILFLSRGENLEAIRENGLLVKDGEQQFKVYPSKVLSAAADAGTVDYLIMAPKRYDLEEMMEQVAPAIGQNTIILPLLNGIDAASIIQQRFPANKVLTGVVYLVSRLIAPGVIEKRSGGDKLFFGPVHHDTGVQKLAFIIKEAIENAEATDDIESVMWEKFVFICSTATATSAHDKSIGQLLDDAEGRNLLEELLEEAIRVGTAEGVTLRPGIKDLFFERLNLLSYEATSSLHHDIRQNKRRTELESLTGYILKTAKKHGIAVPQFEKAYNAINQKLATTG